MIDLGIENKVLEDVADALLLLASDQAHWIYWTTDLYWWWLENAPITVLYIIARGVKTNEILQKNSW